MTVYPAIIHAYPVPDWMICSDEWLRAATGFAGVDAIGLVFKVCLIEPGNEYTYVVTGYDLEQNRWLARWPD